MTDTKGTTCARPNAPLLVLLLVLEEGRRRRLADACRAASPEVEFVESDDDIGAIFSAALDRLDLVVLDGTLAQRYGSASIAHWRRLTPRGSLIVLGPDPEGDLDALRKAILAASRPKA
jgi:hypothetical protein